MTRWKVVPFGEIVINPSDLKHVVELLGCSDGLCMVITTCMHLWDVFERPHTRAPSRCDRIKYVPVSRRGRPLVALVAKERLVVCHLVQWLSLGPTAV